MTPAWRRSDAVTLALVAYGIGALLLLLATLLVVLAALAAVERAAASVDAASGPALTGRLDRLGSSLDEAETALRGFDETLAATSDAARDGQAMGTQLSSSLRRLAASLDIAVLGTRPFEGVGTEFARVADRADALAGELERVAGSLDGNRASLGSLADEVGGLQTELESLREELGGSGQDPGADPRGKAEGQAGLDAASALVIARVLAIAFVAWLAIPAILVVAIGRRRWRQRGQDLVPAPGTRRQLRGGPPVVRMRRRRPPASSTVR
jgi:hypothetical protein